MPNVYQTYLRVLLSEIKRKLNVTSFVYYNSNNDADIDFRSFKIVNFLSRVLFKLGLINYKTYDLKIFKNYDIVHLQHSYFYTRILPVKNLNKNVKTVITLRGGDTYVKPWSNKKWRDFYKDNHQSVDAFITMSQNQKKYLIRWGVPLEKIHVIPISFGKKEDVSLVENNDKKLNLVSIFRMIWQKNINDCLKFAVKLKEQGIDFSYDFYGGATDLGQLYYLIDKYELQHYVNVKGEKKNEILKESLSKYDFLVQLSLSEAFPTSVLEAQSKGVPCIVSDAGGLPESVKDNKTGLVNYNNDLEELSKRAIVLWSDKIKYNEFSENAKQYVNDNFTIENEISSLTELYNTLLEHKS